MNEFLISLCSSRFPTGVEPLVVQFPSGCIVYALDGSGSWGTGAEASAWFRNWIAEESDDSITSPQKVTELLAAGIRAIPHEITECDFHWAFSVAVAICQSKCVQVGASGSIAAIGIRLNGFERLFVPNMLVDELISRGSISRNDAHFQKYRRICCGPFFGFDNNHELNWSAPFQLCDGDRVVLGDAVLPDFLDNRKFTFTTAVETRDAIENYGGSSTPTVIVDHPVTGG